MIKQILVAIDSSSMAEEALKRAMSVAKEKDAQLMVIHVIEPYFLESPYFPSIDVQEVRKKITDQINRLNKDQDVKYILFVESGKAAEVITNKAQKIKADLLVVGSHGKEDIDSNYFGSTTLKLVQRTHIPVLIVKNRVRNIYQKMIAPTDLSDCSSKSILFSNALFAKASRKYLYAAETFSELQAMTIHISKEEQKSIREKMLTDGNRALEKFVKEVGGGEKALIDYTASINQDLLAYINEDDADLLVLGSKGVDNLNSFVFGSTASYLVQRSPIDVLVYVPSPTHSCL